MFKNLSHGVKISITRSISKAYEQYMADIKWSEKAYNLEDFMKVWKKYIETSASWYGKVDAETKADPKFHEDLALKINEVIGKIWSEEPTKDQIAELSELREQLGEDFDYSCKAEAKFYIDYLNEELKKKKNI
ncbi:NurA-like 5'-3' nuclease [Oikeobacillus pervagus]|uniref:NurA-like 5'-3' nuclease n=1 Tax=Oikeobacillus pervagus TaxID=1325931 RepID=A0AAJ1T3D0_9BACI|nr:hypothetical protein [Oikeobacillus pervagus]MDQ0214115.1 NurA-like 5'-3' nuclease [Oikeobacillus pervagus]